MGPTPAVGLCHGQGHQQENYTDCICTCFSWWGKQEYPEKTHASIWRTHKLTEKGPAPEGNWTQDLLLSLTTEQPCITHTCKHSDSKNIKWLIRERENNNIKVKAWFQTKQWWSCSAAVSFIYAAGVAARKTSEIFIYSLGSGSQSALYCSDPRDLTH